MGFHHLQPSLNGGQLSRRLHARPDLGIHAIATAEMTNMVATIEGAAVKRPGTLYRAAALATAARFSEFIFNATQAYVIEWSEGKLRFVTNDVLLEDGGGVVEVTVPYAAADAARVSTEQSGDVLYMAHGDYPHAALSRTAADAFSHDELDLLGGPFDDPNGDDSVTVTVTGTLTVGGSVTVTASDPIFAEGHEGSRMRVEAKDFSAVKAWQEGVDGITIGAERRAENRVYKAQTAGRTGYELPTHFEGSEWDGDATGSDVNGNGPYGVQWLYLYDRFGIIKITNHVSGTVVQGTVERAVPSSLASTASSLWSLGLFNDVVGWPEHVVLWRGRLWWLRDFYLVGSVSGDYRDYNEYSLDGSRQPDMAIRLRLDITDKVLWVRADRNAMILGTARGEYAVGPINPGEPISSDNLQVSRQRRHGSAEVWPVEAGGEVFFVQRGGKKVRAASYDFAEDRYGARHANLYARQVGNGGITELAYQAEPEELLMALRGDGTVAAHPYSPEQEVRGWSTAIAMEGAEILSYASIPSPDAALDDIWLLVDRDGTRSIEQLADWWDDEDPPEQAAAQFLDSAIAYSGAPATSFTGANHLANKTVTVLADGVELTAEVNASGEFELEEAASTVLAGYLFTARIELLDPDLPLRDGTSIGRERRTVKVALNVLDAVTVGIRKKLAAVLERVFPWRVSDPMPAHPPLVSNWSEGRQPGGSTAFETGDVIEDRSPYPWVQRAVRREIDVK